MKSRIIFGILGIIIIIVLGLLYDVIKVEVTKKHIQKEILSILKANKETIFFDKFNGLDRIKDELFKKNIIIADNIIDISNDFKVIVFDYEYILNTSFAKFLRIRQVDIKKRFYGRGIIKEAPVSSLAKNEVSSVALINYPRKDILFYYQYRIYFGRDLMPVEDIFSLLFERFYTNKNVLIVNEKIEVSDKEKHSIRQEFKNNFIRNKNKAMTIVVPVVEENSLIAGFACFVIKNINDEDGYCEGYFSKKYFKDSNGKKIDGLKSYGVLHDYSIDITVSAN